MATPSHCANRATIALALWPEADESTAGHCLASTLWRIKETLKPSPAFIEASEDQIGLRLSRNLWIDVLAFDRRMQSVFTAHTSLADYCQRLRLGRLLGSYEGDFAANIDLPETRRERERLRTLFLDGLYALAMSYFDAGDLAAAARVAQRLCHEEPLREDAHRLLMVARTKSGNRALALRQFEHCRAILARELNVEPMSETTELYRELLANPSAVFLLRGTGSSDAN